MYFSLLNKPMKSENLTVVRYNSVSARKFYLRAKVVPEDLF